MDMKEKIREYLDAAFWGAPDSEENREIKEALRRDLCDRYDDLVASGIEPGVAYSRVIAGVGDIGEILGRSKTTGEGSPAGEAKIRVKKGEAQARRKTYPAVYALKDAGWALALAIYFIVSFLTGAWYVTWVIFLVAAALDRLFNAFVAPKLSEKIGASPALSEEKQRAFNAVTGAIWLLILVVYFVVSFLSGAWSMSWILFLFGWALMKIVKGLLYLRAMRAEGMDESRVSAFGKISAVCAAAYVVAFAALIVALAFGLGSCSTGVGVVYDDRDYLVGNQNYAEQADRIKINWTSGSLLLEAYDGAQILLTEENAPEEESRQVHSRLKDGVLSVYPAASGVGNLFSPAALERKLTVRVPAAMAGAMQSIELDAASAGLSAAGFKVGSFEIDTASGSVTLTDVSVGNTLDIDVASGHISLTRVAAKKIDIDSGSGGGNLSEVTAQTLKIDTSSGGFDCEGSFDRVDIDNASGRFVLTAAAAPSSIDYDAASGSFTLNAPDPAPRSVYADLDAASGKMTVRRADGNVSTGKTYGQKGGVEYHFDTASADVELNFN